ncbi:hypothetical protein BCV69DRAFT_279412 [Microstroma glucosiphilum]|uniref:YCII-related domain-containing protein n=1 Tax=Pseudomicrostroma glucosiphilum TaxID=1684307 RepID=A0A316UE53_9BASI|nr:hypothetical protein BCV69DRAFT_279412 [Pseudomicrostroma glucosiphilum]PWN23462.1 hypothetical protein BCV69DRAFT_279412 [Pseudomicrostroma glucosiphilum]
MAFSLLARCAQQPARSVCLASPSAPRFFSSTPCTLAAGPYTRPTSSVLHPYLIVAQDAPDALSTRLSVREEHLAGAKEGHENGRITLGGALLSKDHGQAGEGKEKVKSIIGSVLVVMAESQEEARKAVEKDVYSTSGVFAKVDVWPFMPALHHAAAQPEATEAAEAAKELANKARASLGDLRETETNKWKEAAMRSLEFLRKGGTRQTS